MDAEPVRLGGTCWGEQVHRLRWFREGTLPVRAQKLGRLILVDMAAPRVSVVARSSVPGCPPTTKRGDLDRQVARLTEWATRRGLSVDEVVDEVDSGETSMQHATLPITPRPTSSPGAARRLETDCEDPPHSSVTLLGCGSVMTNVTQKRTGCVPFLRFVRSWLPAPARLELLA